MQFAYFSRGRRLAVKQRFLPRILYHKLFRLYRVKIEEGVTEIDIRMLKTSMLDACFIAETSNRNQRNSPRDFESESCGLLL